MASLIRIDSPANAAVRRARALEKRAGSRARGGLYLAWGVHLAQEALAAGAPIVEAFVGPALAATGEGRDLAAALRPARLRLAETTSAILESIVEGAGDQGIVLTVRRPETDLRMVLASRPGLVVALHGVQDPGNVGAILRSARGLFARAAVVLPGCADPFGSRAVRAAMGAQFTLPIVVEDIAALGAAREAGLRLVAAASSGETPVAEADLSRPAVLLVGNEGAGLPRAVLDIADCRVRIPMAPGTSSLNVHAAACVLLYEAARQRGFR